MGKKHLIEGGFSHPNCAEKVPSNLEKEVESLKNKIQRAKKEEDLKIAERLKGTGIEGVCDKCGNIFASQMKLNFHRLSCKGK